MTFAGVLIIERPDGPILEARELVRVQGSLPGGPAEILPPEDAPREHRLGRPHPDSPEITQGPAPAEPRLELSVIGREPFWSGYEQGVAQARHPQRSVRKL
mgnify:CR=1 FL=1